MSLVGGIIDLPATIAGHVVNTEFTDIPVAAIDAAKKEVLDRLATTVVDYLSNQVDVGQGRG